MFATEITVPPTVQSLVGHTDLRTQHIHPLHPPSLQGWEGSLFPGLVPINDTVSLESMAGIKPGDSDVLIWYQVD